VRAYSYIETMQAALHRRLDQAEAELRALAPPRQRGKQQIADEKSLLAAIARIEKKRRVQGLFDLSYQQEVAERHVRGKGLFHLLTLGARLLALGDYLAKRMLASEGAELTGIYAGNPKRGTTSPTMERMLQLFADIHLVIFPVQPTPLAYLNQLSPVQERILALLGRSRSLYTNLQTCYPGA